jgi:hypothetical protein
VNAAGVGTADDPRLADHIQLIWIPISEVLPFDPFEPKVAADTLV